MFLPLVYVSGHVVVVWHICPIQSRDSSAAMLPPALMAFFLAALPTLVSKLLNGSGF